jgi:hypothetical protein
MKGASAPMYAGVRTLVAPEISWQAFRSRHQHRRISLRRTRFMNTFRCEESAAE